MNRPDIECKPELVLQSPVKPELATRSLPCDLPVMPDDGSLSRTAAIHEVNSKHILWASGWIPARREAQTWKKAFEGVSSPGPKETGDQVPMGWHPQRPQRPSAPIIYSWNISTLQSLGPDVLKRVTCNADIDGSTCKLKGSTFIWWCIHS